MIPADSLVIGLDFGTDSVRAVLTRVRDGAAVSASVFHYPRWRDGLYCHAAIHQFRQHPLDHLEGLEYVVKDCIRQAGPEAASLVKAIGVDTTGSSPLAVDASGTPLSLLPAFERNPNAMVVLWKDHTAFREAAEINAHAKSHAGGPDYLQFAGGIYSSEWFWAKLLQVLRADEDVRKHCYSWVEHCDWIPFMLTGGTDAARIRRSVCAAGHKALWAKEWKGLPPETFWSSLDPLLTSFRSRLYEETYTSDQVAGALSPQWAGRLGLPAATIVAVGALDAHMGAVGGQIEPYHLSKVMGTSTCDMLVVPPEDLQGVTVKGICGQVAGSIIPGMTGMEAGQSAFGDTYAWFRNLLSWPLQHMRGPAGLTGSAGSTGARGLTDNILGELDSRAAECAFDLDSELAVDWLNGRRTPDADPLLRGAICGLNLGSDAVSLYRALVESTCFGAKKIVRRFTAEGVPIKGLIGVGGIARKSPYIMQVLADTMEMPIRIHSSEQTCAAGAAMFASVAAGFYPRVEAAMEAMGQGFDLTYGPDVRRAPLYEARYKAYERLGNFIEKETYV
jgi:L-ribulokinase